MSLIAKKIKHWHMIAGFLMIYDILVVNGAYLFALLLRFDFRFLSIPEEFLRAFYQFTPFYTAACVLIFSWLNLYRSIWRFASYNELSRIVFSSVLTTLVQVAGAFVFYRMPVSYYIMGSVIQFVLVVAARFSYRFILLLRSSQSRSSGSEAPKIMLVGAGNAGQMILRDANGGKETKGRIVCIIDDNPNKWGRFIDGIPIVGGRNDILDNVNKYDVDRIYVAIPSASLKDRTELMNICKNSGCRVLTLPGIYQFMNEEVTVSNLREVSLEDLLGREPVVFDMSAVRDFVRDKTVLVTGGGGSIGSELCRQIAKYEPQKLIIFDIYENNAYEIQQELRREYPLLDLVVMIGSVRDSRRLNEIFSKYQPDVVYHAAAHKHVPLMEDSPCEAIKNNVIGTYKTAYAAMISGCRKFILISTDKAVNPTNIMGASKRICEKIVQTFDYMIKENRAAELPVLFTNGDDELLTQTFPAISDPVTEYTIVRFGNVLGSNGSVIPLFRKQIAEGGPVTVTSKEIIRYFMTIPEAVSLVLEAGVIGKGAEILVLDMGDPVKIDDLARNLIQLSGLKPDVDIEIKYTGLRPGEKLYEEKLMAEEGLEKTANKLIYIGKPVVFDRREFMVNLNELIDAANHNDETRTIGLVKKMVPAYTPETKVNP